MRGNGITVVDRLLALHARRGWRGRTRVRQLLQRHATTHLIRVKTRHGLVVDVDPDAHMDAFIVRDGYYEPAVLDALLAHLGPNGVLWDVGANIGLHGLTVAALRPDVGVVCFEPAPATFTRLAANARLNGLGRVELTPVALSREPGYLPLSIVSDGNTGLSSLKPWPGVTYEQTVLTRCETAEGFAVAARVPLPTVLKVDVEGAEADVLAGLGAAGALLRAVVFEAQAELADRPDDFEAVRLLRAEGFGAPRPIATDGARPTNFLMTKDA